MVQRQNQSFWMPLESLLSKLVRAISRVASVVLERANTFTNTGIRTRNPDDKNARIDVDPASCQIIYRDSERRTKVFS